MTGHAAEASAGIFSKYSCGRFCRKALRNSQTAWRCRELFGWAGIQVEATGLIDDANWASAAQVISDDFTSPNMGGKDAARAARMLDLEQMDASYEAVQRVDVTETSQRLLIKLLHVLCTQYVAHTIAMALPCTRSVPRALRCTLQ